MIDIIKECEGAKLIGITGHTNPDGDCIGTTLGLWQFLKKAMPQTEVTVYLEPIPEQFLFIKGAKEICQDYTKDICHDVMFVMDSVPERCGDAQKYIDSAKKVINIDHHISNKGLCQINYIKPQASSAAQVLYELIASKPEYKAHMDMEMAQTIYIGVIHDSGVMQYSNTSPETLRIVADLISYGFDFSKLIDETFYEKTQKQSKILGKALMDAKPYLDGKCMTSLISKETMDEFDVVKADLSGIVNQLRIIKGVVVAVFGYQIDEETYKFSLRSCTDDVDVSKVSGVFGGGGHVRAAGCSIKGAPEECLEKILKELEKQL